MRPAWLALVAARLVVASSPLCAFVSEGEVAVLTCPEGAAIVSVSSATFGTFDEASSCASGLHLLPDCPTTVTAAVDVLCRGLSSCALSCTAGTDPARCTVGARSLAFPGRPCAGQVKHLAVQATCARPEPAPAPAPPSIVPTELLLEFLESPRGVDTLRPHFAWQPPRPVMRATSAQVAFEVTVASSSGDELWSSGRVASAEPLFRHNQALPLRSDTAYSWKVRVWSDDAQEASAFSEPANFSTGLFSQDDWEGTEWIGGGNLLRKEFQVARPLSRATVFVSACQYYELYVDGRRVGRNELDVVWTRFDRNRSYATHELDVALLAPGPHALGLMVGQGFCGESDGKAGPNQRAALLRLALHDAQGHQEIVGTDTTWSAGQGPIVYDSTYYGESFDARLEQPGWSTVGFKPAEGKSWKQAILTYGMVQARKPYMTSQLMPPIQVVREWQPLQVTRLSRTSWSVDFGQEFAGRVRLELSDTLSAGARLTLQHAEVLTHPPFGDYDGSVWMGNLFWANPVDTYTVAAIGANQTYEPRFTYHGFRYVQVSIDESPGTCGEAQEGENLTLYCPSGKVSAVSFASFGSPSGSCAGSLAEGACHAAASQTTLERACLGQASCTLQASNEAFGGDPCLGTAKRLAVRISCGGLAAPLQAPKLTAVNLRSAVREQGTVTLRNQMLQRLSDNAWWTEAAGLMGIPSGCAARGERAGWTGDGAFAAESEMFDFDTAAFFIQYLGQLRDSMCQDGSIPNVVPWTDPRRDGPAPLDPPQCSGSEGDPTWGTVYPTIAWNLWRYYGASGTIEDHWPNLQLYGQMLEQQYSKTGLKTYFCTWGDWNPVIKTQCHVTSAASFLHDLLHLADLAAAVGDNASAQQYHSRFETLKAEYHDAFYDTSKGVYADGTQTAQALPLWLGSTPPELREAVLGKLVDDMLVHGCTGGFVGVRYVFEALAMAGRIDVALRVLQREEYPGFGYEIFNLYEPATALWESWDGDTHRQWLDESSRDHHYQASIRTFLRRFVAGLDMPSGTAAWRTVRARPEAALVPEDLAAQLPGAVAEVRSHRGLVRVAWARVAGGLTLNITVPPGSAGEVHVPKIFGEGTVVEEARRPVWDGHSFVPGVDGIVSAKAELRFVVFETWSGSYSFTATTAAVSIV